MDTAIMVIGMAFLVVAVGAGVFIAFRTHSDLHRVSEGIEKLSKAVNGKHIEKRGRHSSKIIEVNPSLKIVEGGKGWGG